MLLEGPAAAPTELNTDPVPHTPCHTGSPGAPTRTGVARLEPCLHGKRGRACLGARVCSEDTGREIEVFKETWPAQEHADSVHTVILPQAEEGL